MLNQGASLDVPFWAWLVLGGVVLLSLLVDLVGHRGEHGLGRRQAILWSCAWVALAVAFGGWIAFEFGRAAAVNYATAYLIEKSLSVDNLFLFLVIFARLSIPQTEQHRVLLWGILGAFATRAAFIGGGTALLEAWHGVVYVLGAFLIFTGVKTAREPSEAAGESKMLRFLQRHLPLTPRLHGHRFFVVESGRRLATPLLLALIVIELTDVLFAVDSIPAVFAITGEPFIVYSSNVFAILGMRALYLVLQDLLTGLAYLRFGLAAILIFAGTKMLGSQLFHVPHAVSLLVIFFILVASIVPSVVSKRRRARAERLRVA
ncbi:TerC/Alx family metal homeostasis membrane protein [Sorangium sp. So ce321]|uniref:TerC/Alx family metal homeostasis membrane protein n=1 Tax=Sorangium sp. So ce321 TaxID=3133300 RepID=UPI003F60F89B